MNINFNDLVTSVLLNEAPLQTSTQITQNLNSNTIPNDKTTYVLHVIEETKDSDGIKLVQKIKDICSGVVSQETAFDKFKSAVNTIGGSIINRMMS